MGRVCPCTHTISNNHVWDYTGVWETRNLQVSKSEHRREVADEEARQWRAFNLLGSVLRLRCLPTADLCHPLWNDWKRSLGALNGTLLKCSTVCNWGHGPFQSGSRFTSLKFAGEKLVRMITPQHLDALTERVAFDRGWPNASKRLCEEEIRNSASVGRRIPYVTRLILSERFVFLFAKTSLCLACSYLRLSNPLDQKY